MDGQAPNKLGALYLQGCEWRRIQFTGWNQEMYIGKSNILKVNLGFNNVD